MLTKLDNNVYALDKCLYVEQHKAIVLADLHIGYEEHLSKKGVFIPRTQFEKILKCLVWVFEQVEIKLVILNGDIKHDFAGINDQEWREVTRLITWFRSKNVEILAVRGNHDTIFGPLARKLKVKEVKELRLPGILIAHGDYVPTKLEKIILIGHEHPAFTLEDDSKKEKFKAFLKCKFKGATIICQPSFNPLTIGTDITSDKLLSPLLKNAKKGEVFLVNDKSHEVLEFGKVQVI